MRSLWWLAVVCVALLSGSHVAHVATEHGSGGLIAVGQVDDKLAHESDRELVDDFILAYSVDFDWRVQDELTSGQITSGQARTMKQQFYAAGTGFADQMRELFDVEYSNKPFDENLRKYLRKSIRDLWAGKELVP